MNAAMILDVIASHGGAVRLVDGQPRMAAPQPLPADLIAEARAHKAGIVDLLMHRSVTTPGVGCDLHGVTAERTCPASRAPTVGDQSQIGFDED